MSLLTLLTPNNSDNSDRSLPTFQPLLMEGKLTDPGITHVASTLHPLPSTLSPLPSVLSVFSALAVLTDF
jgi:hypothetical protein